MGLFSKKPKVDEAALTLAQTWTTLGPRLGLVVEVHADDAITAEGTVNGRGVKVEIAAGSGNRLGGAIADFAQEFSNQRSRKKTKRRPWRPVLAVACTNPRQLTGTITSAVDVNDPAWNPRNFDPAHCRVVRAEPAALAAAVLTPAVNERLLGVVGDVSLAISPEFVAVAREDDVSVEAGFIAASIIHQLPISLPPWPDKGLIGPPWWIDTLCVVADALDRA